MTDRPAIVFDVITILPDFFKGPLETGVIGRAIEKGILGVNLVNPRDFASDKHRTTDDYPYGGGHGMVMKPEPVVAAIESTAKAAEGAKRLVVLLAPEGRRLDQRLVERLSSFERLALVCGRYEGFDERIRSFVDEEISVGDYILTGAEAAAMAIIDAAGRLVKGVLGEPGSLDRESFSDGLLEHPQYTRPEEFRGLKVPDVLLSGNHGAIEAWRRREGLKRTLLKRPDMIEGLANKDGLSKEDLKLLDELKYNQRS